MKEFPAGRFTPAYAGKIKFLLGSNVQSEVHPRIRGEDFRRTRRSSFRLGSPPHTRGRFQANKAKLLSPRFTPAYAGKIAHCLPKLAESGVHPRIRGEDPVTSSLMTN